MIDLYYCPTPNCQKVSITLEELGLPYNIKPIDIVAGDQNDPAFFALSPNRKVPVIVDHAGPDDKPLVLWESAAILLYLAEKGNRLWPEGASQQALGNQWLFWQMSYVGPMMGQLHHFVRYAPEQLDYPIGRYSQEVERLRRMLDKHLAGQEFILNEYSIADIACFPWFKMFGMGYPDQGDYPHLNDWIKRIFERPAVQKGMAVDLDKIRPVVIGAVPVTDEVRTHLFASYQSGDGPTR